MNPPGYPNAGDVSYNFTLLDEMFSDFMSATYAQASWAHSSPDCADIVGIPVLSVRVWAVFGQVMCWR